MEEQTTAGGQPMSEYWKNAWTKACARETEARIVVADLKKKLALAGGASVKENAEVAQWFRNHLDEGHPMDDNHWEKKARQVMWNDQDAELEGDEE